LVGEWGVEEDKGRGTRRIRGTRRTREGGQGGEGKGSERLI
jgi:hypothetical protein